MIGHEMECVLCSGRGLVDGIYCRACRGSGLHRVVALRPPPPLRFGLAKCPPYRTGRDGVDIQRRAAAGVGRYELTFQRDGRSVSLAVTADELRMLREMADALLKEDGDG